METPQGENVQSLAIAKWDFNVLIGRKGKHWQTNKAKIAFHS